MSKYPQKVAQTFGFFWKNICHQELSQIAQSSQVVEGLQESFDIIQLLPFA